MRPGYGRLPLAWADQAFVRSEQRIDIAGDLHPGGRENDQVITDAIKVRDEMR